MIPSHISPLLPSSSYIFTLLGFSRLGPSSGVSPEANNSTSRIVFIDRSLILQQNSVRVFSYSIIQSIASNAKSVFFLILYSCLV